MFYVRWYSCTTVHGAYCIMRAAYALCNRVLPPKFPVPEIFPKNTFSNLAGLRQWRAGVLSLPAVAPRKLQRAAKLSATADYAYARSRAI